MVERDVHEAQLAEDLERSVHDPREAPRARGVPDEAELVVGRPRPLRDPGRRRSVQPTTGHSVHHRLSPGDQFGEALEELPARGLVVVEAEDPVALALRVQPAQAAVERRRIELEALVGEVGALVEDLGIAAPVGREHDLVDEWPELLEDRAHPRCRPACHDAQREGAPSHSWLKSVFRTQDRRRRCRRSTSSRPTGSTSRGTTGNEPVLTIESGDTVIYETRDVSDNQITPDSTAEAIARSTGIASTRWRGRCSSKEPSRATRSRSRSSTCRRAAGATRRSSPASACCPTTSRTPYLRDLRPLGRRLRVPARRHRDPRRAVLRDDGRLSRGREAQEVMPPGRSAGTWTRGSSSQGTTLYLPVEVAGALSAAATRTRLRATARSA